MMNFKNVIFKQHGQAMVEYAILLILMVTLIMGGLELSVTAYNSKKTGDAAEAGANAWAEAVSFSKANPTDSSELSSSQFERMLEQERQALNIDTDTDIGEVSDITADQERPSLNSSCIGDVGFSVEPTEFISLPIDITRCDPAVKSKSNYDPSTDPDSDANTLNGIRALVLELYPTAGGEYRALDPYYDFITVCTREDATTGNIEKIVECKTNRNAIANVDVFDTDTAPSDGIQDACATPPGPCSDNIEDDETDNGGLDSDDPTYRKLLVLKELKNTEEYNAATSASTPTQQGVKTNADKDGEKFYHLGNHNPTRTDSPFRRPSCSTAVNGNQNDYDDGLPTDGRIYLFNPLPIDITNCTGNDTLRGGRSRASILAGGYSGDSNLNNTQDLNVRGLPAVNQAVYSEYTKVCVVLNGNQISIARNGSAILGLNNCISSGGLIWLKPPGKMCGAPGGTEVCATEGNLNGATGFYFFGDGNVGGKFEYHPSSAATPYFRPSFQLVCDSTTLYVNSATHQSNLYDADDGSSGIGYCNDLVVNQGAGAFRLQVNVRYRSIFESFITFGSRELRDASLVQYFYNPNGVGTTNALVGASGSEVGPIGSNGRPGIKQFKDFRGCYQVEITPPENLGDQIKSSVSSCN